MLTGSTEKEKRAQMAASFAEDEVPVFPDFPEGRRHRSEPDGGGHRDSF